MNILKSLFAPSSSDSNVLMLYVKCKRCGTPLAVRVNLANDLNADYDSGGYILYKEMMDSQCFTLMRAEIRFDAARKIVEQKIDQGEFLTREQYKALMDERQKPAARLSARDEALSAGEGTKDEGQKDEG